MTQPSAPEPPCPTTRTVLTLPVAQHKRSKTTASQLQILTLVCPAISMLTPSKSPNAVPKVRDEAASCVGLRTDDTTSADASLRFAAAEFSSCCSCL